MDVSTADLPGGGVSIVDMSLTPISERYNVLGIGVAERVSTSIRWNISLNLSLCLTPNLCSSSIIAKPMFLNLTSF